MYPGTNKMITLQKDMKQLEAILCTTVSYNAMNSLVRFEKKSSSLAYYIQRWRWSCEFISRTIGSPIKWILKSVQSSLICIQWIRSRPIDPFIRHFGQIHFVCNSSGLPDIRYIFEPKIPIWVNFGGSFNGRCSYILRPLGLLYIRPYGIFCGHLAYFSPFWYVVPRKLWQPCDSYKEVFSRHSWINAMTDFMKCVGGSSVDIGFNVGPVQHIFTNVN
jgi:hypothetical protein